MLARLTLAGALFLTSIAASAQDGARERGTVLMPENEQARAFQEQIGFSDAVITETGQIYLSGVVVGLGPNESDLEAAFARAYERIGNTLQLAGAGWDDVVDILSFHTDLTTQLTPMVTVQRRHIQEPFPAWTAIGVSRLFPDRGIAEIKIVAQLPADDD